MSAFARFLHPTPTTRRAYSSFFSSKPGGGGRYFNSAKPPKVIPGSAAKGAPNKVDSPTESSADGVQTTAGGGGSGAANGGNQPNGLMNANGDQGAPASKASSASSSSSSATNEANPESDTNHPLAGLSGHAHLHHMHRQHPVVTPKDFKLHQFFSLHRPLLLLAQPSSILSSTAPEVDPTSIKPRSSATETSNHPWLLDEFAEASMDADAAAARQLTRALTMNHAGATVAWEDTLRRLGLDVDKDADRVGLQQQWVREWEEVLMDSTKRKRKKKMKKHKSVTLGSLWITLLTVFCVVLLRLKKRRKVKISTPLLFGRLLTLGFDSSRQHARLE